MMTGAGRPLRFLVVVLGLWLGGRMLMLGLSGAWSMSAASGDGRMFQQHALRDHGGPRPAALAGDGQALRSHAWVVAAAPVPLPPPLRRAGGAALSPAVISGWSDESADMQLGAAASFLAPRRASSLFGRLTNTVSDSPGLADALVADPGGSSVIGGDARRWGITAWLLWRPDVASGFAQSPLLGGSQAGARLDYRLAEGRLGRIGAYARLSRALTGPSSEEGAVGLAWRPGRLPVSLLAERRQRLGPGGRSGFALMAAGGLGPHDVAPRVQAEGYAQAGVVGAPGLDGFVDGFADGRASLGYRLTSAANRHDLSLGAGVSGSAQPGAERLDVGPELRLRLPLGTGAMRLSTEWRERIAGDARPARGPAVTLIAVF